MCAMLTSELMKLFAQGEGANIEFKRDDIRPEDLAKTIVAFANMRGGRILLGVADDGTPVGIVRKNLQEWLMDTVIGTYVRPAILPDYEEITIGENQVAIATVPQGVAKPYVRKYRNRKDIYVRTGNTNRIADREQSARLFSVGGLLGAEEFPVHGSTIHDLDKRRYSEFFESVLQEPQRNDWQSMLINWGFLVKSNESYCCSYFAHALFAKRPGIRLPHACTRVTVYTGTEKDYDTELDDNLDMPIVEYQGENASDPIEPAVHQQIIHRIKPYISEDKLHKSTRRRVWDYPHEAIRELLINALVHRDWTRNNSVRVVVYDDRLEITSPGGLPNGMTVEKIKSGVQSVRNPKCARVMRGYGYLEDQGMGIRRKVIPLMLDQNGIEPIFDATEDAFKVTLYKSKTLLPHVGD